MSEKTIQVIFITLFFGMVTVPLFTTNLQKEKISAAENRKLAPMAEIYNEDGTINGNFNNDFETWINDNIGMRSRMVIDNAKMQYYLFKVLANNSDMFLGPNGEFDYATPEMIADYQHFDLYSKEYLQEIVDSMQYLNDCIESAGKQFYYFQCWDKHSIYPEYFPNTIIQHGPESKTDLKIKALRARSDVKVISPKDQLIAEKLNYETYSKWGDASHWTQRGAYIGYRLLMNTINANSDTRYRVLEESDYIITKPDLGSTLFGGIHKADYLEKFEIKAPQAVITNDKITLYADDQRHRCFTNDSVNNRTRLLVIGDSYFNSFIIDDLAESFYETIIIWGDHANDVESIIDTYNPDIVIVEDAERCDRTGAYINGVNAMKESKLSEDTKQDN